MDQNKQQSLPTKEQPLQDNRISVYGPQPYSNSHSNHTSNHNSTHQNPGTISNSNTELTPFQSIIQNPQSSTFKNLISIDISKLQNPNILSEQEKVLYNSLRQVLNLSHITNNQGNQSTAIKHNLINQPETDISSSLSTPTPPKNSNEFN